MLTRSEDEGERCGAMEVVCERCCGIDVHKKSVVAYVVTPGRGGRRPRRCARSGR